MIEIEHDYQLVEMLAATTEGNARAHRARMKEERDRNRLGWTRHEMLAASGFAVAASYWSLIDPHRAVAAYRLAAATYREIEHDYWIVAALAAGDRSAAGVAQALQETEPSSPQTLAFAMVAFAIVAGPDGSSGFEGMSKWWSHFGNVPVGRLGIPLDIYRRCAQAMMRRDRESLMHEAPHYFARAAEVIGAASQDRFHWRSMLSSILPAEPEAAAMATAMSVVARELDINPRQMAADAGAHGLRLMDVGMALRDAVSSDGDDDDQLRALAREYDRVRARMLPGEERTRVMSDVAARMRAASHSWAKRLPELIDPGSPGERLAAVIFLQEHPDEAYLFWLSRLFSETDPFIGYHAALALRTAARILRPLLVREALSSALRAVPPGTDRERVLREAVRVLDSRY